MSTVRALTPTQVVTRLSQLGNGWALAGSGSDTAIEKAFAFDDYRRVIEFVNAVAFVANRMDHHPDLSVHYGRCVVRFNTHSVQGLSDLDFEAAARVDALLA